jgi:transposase
MGWYRLPDRPVCQGEVRHLRYPSRARQELVDPMTMTSSSLLARAHDDGVVDEPDPAARPRRRSFTAEYKARIVEEYDALPAGSTERGALLRRVGLYTSHISEWRKARDAGARDGLAPKPKTRRSAEQVELDFEPKSKP